jgi:hypothetical protein
MEISDELTRISLEETIQETLKTNDLLNKSFQ